MIPLKPTTTMVQTSRGPIKAIHIKVPVGIPTADGGLEIPNRVFLGGIHNETTELELETFFCDYGLVKDVRIVTDRITGESKGYGFVTFDENEDISKLLKNQTIIMKGKKLRVRKAIRRNSSQFVNNESNCSTSPDSTSSSGSGSTSGSGISSKETSNSGFTEPLFLFRTPNETYGNSQQAPYPYINNVHQSGFYTMPSTTMHQSPYPMQSQAQYQHTSSQPIHQGQQQQIAHQSFPSMHIYPGQYPQQSYQPTYFVPYNPGYYHGYQMY